MIQNNLSILPFYDSTADQNHRRFQSFGQVFPLMSHGTKFIPFQIRRDHLAGTPITILRVHSLIDNSYESLLDDAPPDITINEFESDGYDLIVNVGQDVFGNDATIQPGQFYLSIGDGTNLWYSDVFSVVEDLSQLVKIEYYDSTRFETVDAHIDYSNNYKNVLYVASDIGKPEYPHEEQAKKRDGKIFIEKQISGKKFKFKFLASEPLCDAIRIIRMHDYINIYSRGEIYNVENIILDPKWEDQGDIAVVECEFECDSIIKKTGKTASIDATAIDEFGLITSDDFLLIENNNIILRSSDQ